MKITNRVSERYSGEGRGSLFFEEGEGQMVSRMDGVEIIIGGAVRGEK